MVRVYGKGLEITDPQRGRAGNSVILNYCVRTGELSGGVTISVSDFRQYWGLPVHRELSDVLKGNETVIGIENFFPYGVKCNQVQKQKGLGAAVMENLVAPLAREYEASLLYCHTGSEDMKKLLGKFNFNGIESYTPDMFGRLWQPFYKLL